MREGLISNVPDLETHTFSSSSPIFPLPQPLSPLKRHPAIHLIGWGPATALPWESGLRNDDPAHPWGTWYEGVWGETWAVLGANTKSQPQSPNLSPAPNIHTFQGVSRLKNKQNKKLLATASQIHTSLGWPTMGGADTPIVPNFPPGGAGIER